MALMYVIRGRLASCYIVLLENIVVSKVMLSRPLIIDPSLCEVTWSLYKNINLKTLLNFYHYHHHHQHHLSRASIILHLSGHRGASLSISLS